MRGPAGVFAAAALLLCNATYAATARLAVPVRFHGEWNSSLAKCKTHQGEMDLVITAGRVRFYESEGPVRAVVTRGRQEMAIISELSGEGASWLALSHFQLSADGSKLSETAGSATVVRYRCAGVRASR